MPFEHTKKCNAISKRSGKECKNPAITGHEKCRMHGGATPKGIASAHFKTGRYSRSLPTGIHKRYEEAGKDEELTGLRDEIALVDVLLFDRLDKIYKGESIDYRESLKQLYKQFSDDLRLVGFITEDEFLSLEGKLAAGLKETNKANRKQTHKKDSGTEDLETVQARIKDTLKAITHTIERGRETYFVFEAIQPFLEQRRKLAESENKRLERMGHMITAEQAYAMIARAAEVVKCHVTDPEILRAISKELAQAVDKL